MSNFTDIFLGLLGLLFMGFVGFAMPATLIYLVLEAWGVF